MDGSGGNNGDVTRLLLEFKSGDKKAEGLLMDAVYPQLKRIAARQLQKENRVHTLQPTALVNEAYLHMVGQIDRNWASRCHFFAVASYAAA